ncbi:MAG TPA: hypothetical protein VMF09_02140 [Solirubrobacteraceae bacterium]|nr:hypothetical protein [Solirubrobacteraceae bacterium]
MLCVAAGVGAAISLAAPEYELPPEITHSAGTSLERGTVLTCDVGSWIGSPTFEVEWILEGEVVARGKSPVTQPTLTLTAADEHKELWCEVAATSNGETSYATSKNAICLGGGCGAPPPTAPESVERPEVSVSGGGTPEVGKTLTCSQGAWQGTTPMTFAYKWFISVEHGVEAIKSATQSSYTVVAEDETHQLSCRVTAKNAAGEATAESKNSLEVPGSPPANITKPEVSGVAAVGEPLTCKEGTWSGSPPLEFEIKWLRDGKAIGSGSTHLVESADEGQLLSCTVTAKNGKGKAEASSAAVEVKGKLKNTEPPSISPKSGVKEGTPLTCSEGKWNQNELKLEYHWLREGTETVGDEAKYTVTNADRGHLLYCQVTAKNGKKEEVTATSESVSVVKGAGVPVNERAPKVEGETKLGETLTCTEGTWTNSPESGRYVYQWLREKVAIAGKTEKTYKVQVADEGYKLSCKVIAFNSEGPSEPAESAERYVTGEAPSVTTRGPEAVAESATPRVGESLACLRGEWKGEPAPTFTYEWLRDGATVVGTNAAYTIVSADRGHSLSCRVTATNDEAPKGVSAESNSVHIPGSPPEPPPEGPVISFSGELNVGSTLTCAEGVWTGAPAPTFAFQWLVNGKEIASATAPTFTVGAVDRGYVITCRVTGTNTEGTTAALSKGVKVSGILPKAEELPFVVGTGVVGHTLKCESGIWDAKPPPSFEYQWFRDNTPIASATEETYTVEPADQGQFLSCEVTATNIVGSVPEESSNGVAVSVQRTLETPVETPTIDPPVKTLAPSPAVILASIRRQLPTALGGAHLKTIRKSGSFSFSFLAPWEGKLEVLWYEIVKGAHGAKTKQLVLAQATSSFTGAKKGTVKLKLTAKGRHVLQDKKRMSLKAEVLFTLPHEKPVTWYETLTLTS